MRKQINILKMSNTDYISIGLFIDGGYYAKINEGLREKQSSNINIKELCSFIKNKIAGISGAEISDCQIVENHYYRGRYRAGDAHQKDLLYDERKFEDSLIDNDINFHYKHLRQYENRGNVSVVEKGVDVWFALEAYEITLFRELDYVVLITGDADHEMLVKKLKAIKTKVILLTWDTSEHSATSRLLSEEACRHWEINKLIKTDNNLQARLCKKI